MPFKVESGVEHYRIVGPNGEEGEPVPYEAIATLKIGREIYYCDATEDPDSDNHTVERVATSYAEQTITEDVFFDGEEQPEGEEGEEDEDEEEEEVGPELVS